MKRTGSGLKQLPINLFRLAIEFTHATTRAQDSRLVVATSLDSIPTHHWVELVCVMTGPSWHSVMDPLSSMWVILTTEKVLKLPRHTARWTSYNPDSITSALITTVMCSSQF